MHDVDWAAEPPFELDICTGFYPLADGSRRLHPCLITKVERDRESGLYLCHVICGSSKLKSGRYNEKHDLIISDPDALRDVGLFAPTRFYFSMSRRVPLWWNDTDFGCWPNHATPLVGSLPDDLAKEAGYCLMHAEVQELPR